MLRPERVQNHKINGTLRGNGKMALIVHYILVGVIWVSKCYKRFCLVQNHEFTSSE